MTNQEAIEILREKIFPCVIGDWKEAVGVAISALQAQEAKHSTESSLTQKALDTISRQAAIDVCDNAIDLWHGQLGEGIVIAVKKKIEELPSAQPEIEERKEESAQNVPIEGLISRKAAIDALGEEPPVWYGGEDEIAERNQWRRDVTAIKELPSAQPTLQPTCNELAKDICVPCKDSISRQAAIDAEDSK